MLFQIPGILSKEQVAEIRALLDRTEWVDGRVTAGHQSAQAKFNQQLPQGSEAARRAGALVVQQLYANPLFISAVLPHRIFPPLFNRYGEGMKFDSHVDNAVRRVPASGENVRTDVSCTLFLAEPADYAGGELLIEDAYGLQEVKLPAGDLVVYPASSLHRVTPVTRGQRVASFFWVQSLVRDDGDRALLFDLDRNIQRLTLDQARHPSVLMLTNCYHNLLRRWAET